MMIKNIKNKFVELFESEPLIIRSPGRVNLIGEHTDYNNGFVLPAAIDKAIYFAISKRDDDIIKLYSYDLNDSCEADRRNIEKPGQQWPGYLLGVVDQFNKRGYKISGFNCVFGGDIPIGAGLSSSAAIEAGLAFALNHINELNIDKLTLVQMAQKAENEFVGVNCGIMDQFINIFGEKGQVLKIDCRSLEYELLPFSFDNISIVLFNTNVSHSLASSEYNQRRIECGSGVEIIKSKYPQIESLRDVNREMLEECKEKMDEVVYRRCKYVVEENERIALACVSLGDGDLTYFGKLMTETHYGLSNDYEVSCEELDYLVELVKGQPGIYGSRMMGGGFGGCTINLIEKEKVKETVELVLNNYKEKFNREATAYITAPDGGTGII